MSPSYRAANPAGVALWEAIEQRSANGPRLPFTPGTPSAPLDPARLPPMLVLTGDADLYMPPPMLRDFAASLPGAHSAVFAEAGHAVFWEQPLGFNKVVLDFIHSAS